jgi:hypothetical protein
VIVLHKFLIKKGYIPMLLKKYILKFSVMSLLCGLSVLPFQTYAKGSQVMAESCALGSTCTIPGNDGGLTYFIVTPKTGTDYNCTVWTEPGAEFSVWAFDGKDYNIESGDGVFTVNPRVLLQIKGKFVNPNDPSSVGQIKFQAISNPAKGYVTCNPAP